LVLQLYILLQRVSFFCAIFWICSFIVKIKNRAHLEKKKIRMRKSEENKR